MLKFEAMAMKKAGIILERVAKLDGIVIGRPIQGAVKSEDNS